MSDKHTGLESVQLRRRDLSAELLEQLTTGMERQRERITSLEAERDELRKLLRRTLDGLDRIVKRAPKEIDMAMQAARIEARALLSRLDGEEATDG